MPKTEKWLSLMRMVQLCGCDTPLEWVTPPSGNLFGRYRNQPTYLLKLLHIPQAHADIAAAAGEEPAIGGEGEGLDLVGMAGQGGTRLAEKFFAVLKKTKQPMKMTGRSATITRTALLMAIHINPKRVVLPGLASGESGG